MEVNMLHLVSYKKTILFDRSVFERLSFCDIEKVKEKFEILCPDVFLSECFNPSDNCRKKVLKEKILSLGSVLIFVHNGGNELLSHFGIYANIRSGQFQDNNLAYMSSQTVLESLDLKWLRNMMDSYNINPNQRGYDYYLDDSDEGKSFNDLIDALADKNNMDHTEKKKLKNCLKNVGAVGTSQEPEDIARSVDNLILMHNFGRRVETYEDMEKIIEAHVPYNSFSDRVKYSLFYDWMIFYMEIGKSARMKGLDGSYFNDFMYCYYIPFCDLFITAEKTFPSVLKPISDRFDFINFITFEEFKDRFLK